MDIRPPVDWPSTLKPLSKRVREAVEKVLQKHPENQLLLDQLEQLVVAFPARAPTAKEQLHALRRLDELFSPQAPGEATVPATVVAPKLFSEAAASRMDQAFAFAGRPFFELFSALKEAHAGRLSPAELLPRYESALHGLYRHRKEDGKPLAPSVLNRAFEVQGQLGGLFAKLSGTKDPNRPEWAKAFGLYQEVVTKLAKDQGIHLTEAQGGTGTFGALRLMSEREESFERLKEEDPETYAVLLRRKTAFRELDRAIDAAVRANGMEPKKTLLMGRPVTLGTDKVTGEERVFDLDGEVLPVEAFIAKRKAFLASMERLSRVPERTEVPLDKLRALSDGELSRLQGEPIYVALTDDQAKEGRLTRLYPTQWRRDPATGVEERVITDGRFKGIYLDDLVNSEGRLVEGTAYSFHPTTGRVRGVPVRSNPGEREPYVTTAWVKEKGELREKLFLQLPHFQGEWTTFRRAVRALSNAIPSVRYQEGSKNACFYFEPKDFAAVREAVSGMSLSTSALGTMKRYFKELAEAEKATQADLKPYTPEAIGGFRQTLRGKGGERVPLRFLDAQKRALAWLEANGNRGVVALDTGVGKTAVAIAAMQKMLRDGFAAEPGSNGRFLFVAPPALRGNLLKEMYRFLTPEAREALQGRVDVMTYRQLAHATKEGRWNGKPFDSSKYVAAFFDEAQALKSLTTQAARAALSMKNPRKISLTASPLEKDPMEAYILAAISNNIDLTHPTEGKALRREMRKFRERFIERVGGRIVGVKKDPLVKRDLDTWVKRNVFFADKREVAEFNLPPLRSSTESLVMEPTVEEAYRKAAREVALAMRGLVSVYRDKGLLEIREEGGQVRTTVNPLAQNKEIGQVFSLKCRETIRTLNTLANMPEKLVPGAGYPKIDRAAEIIWERLRRSDGESQTLLFTEDKEMAQVTAQKLSLAIPGKLHAVADAEGIRLFKNGEELSTYRGFELPFHAREYRADVSRPADPETNRRFKASEWQQFVLGQLLSNDRDVASLTALGQTYQNGQNLQAFDAVIHLDRDTWNSEDMKQRTARAWRQGQDNPVDEYTLDAVYAEPDDPFDQTLDEVRKHYQVLEGKLFDDIIKEAQTTELGKEWFTVAQSPASSLQTDPAVVELVLSPYLSRAAEAA